MKSKRVIVIGAGPYGLSVAAHLESLGVEYVVFGKPLDTWINHMPKGMMLKSDGFASNLSAPFPDSSLKAYSARNNLDYHDSALPVPLENFTNYGKAFQQRFVKHLDERTVQSLNSDNAGFSVVLDDGSTLTASQVVVCAGITHFAHVPEFLMRLGAAHVSHSSAHNDLQKFNGRSVAVVGAGSSAVDIAVHLADAGAKVSLLSRAETIRFSGTGHPGKRSSWRSIRHPTSGLGPGLRSRIFSDFPGLFRLAPARLRLKIVGRHLGPSSPGYLREPLYTKAHVLTGTSILQAQEKDGRIILVLQDKAGTTKSMECDHVVAATGYKVDLGKVPFFTDTLRDRITTVGNFPRLNASMETSVPGLYFAGIAAAGSFGPLMRFVFGTEYAARRISQAIAR